MKKISLFTTLGVAAIFTMSAHSESTGRITFNGQITGTTCNVMVASQSNNATITLPTVSSSQLTELGKVAGTTDFDMVLTDCSTAEDDMKTVSAYFEAGDQVDTQTGRLNNQITDGAGNVTLQLLDRENMQPIKIGADSQKDGSTYAKIEDGRAVLNYAVQYHAERAVTPGLVSSYVTYSLQYQ
ncbi:TPA: type 1 fimbrial protein [Klebsiella quasipneumoniae subsp. similipneumoniae]|nr:type 1 fimbrial protein [Klebsiella quasipneumoniae subsp. similipneumoniae]